MLRAALRPSNPAPDGVAGARTPRRGGRAAPPVDRGRRVDAKKSGRSEERPLRVQETWSQISLSWPCLLGGSALLLRKEVIQPHLPVQLPCYDLTPVMSHTLNARPIGETTRLRVQPTPMV